jgi:hypothetical protein
MPRPLQAALSLACTVALLLLFLAIHPFLLASDALDAAFHVPPKWTQIENVYRDPNTQEVTHGDAVVPSLKILAGYWGGKPGATRILFVGNSQMHTVSLAKGEAKPTGIEKTYVDQISDRLHRTAPNTLTYRLSSSGMSYPEVLWDLTYMMGNPDLKPDAIVLQLNYQAFWTGGIRDSILPLLDDPGFHARIEAMASLDRPYAGAFQEALHRYEEQSRTQPSGAGSSSSGGAAATFTPSSTPGYAIETKVRGWLDHISLVRRRADEKEEFAQLLYRGRLYFLRLKPSTARSVTGSRLLAARGAVVDIVTLCHRQNIPLFLFNAPVNPLVSLYRTPEDKNSFDDFIHQAAQENGRPLYNFEDTVSASHWGNLLNGPDPLHMGREAHALMAQEMYATIPLEGVSSHR